MTEMITTIAVGGKKQATSMPIPRKMAANAAVLGRIFNAASPHSPLITRIDGFKNRLLYYMSTCEISD